MPDRPNIVLIVLDTVRADALEPYGAVAGATPVLSDLARSGEVAERAYANASWTLPSHASMFTGLLPRAAGLARAPGGRPTGCRPVLEAHRDRLLPEVLRRSGYRTLGVSTNLWLTDHSGFDIGFDDFSVVDTQRQNELVGSGLRSRARWVAEAVRASADDGGREAQVRLRHAIDQSGPGPFFAFVNLVEAHSPYLPPRPYAPFGPLDRARAAVEARRYLSMNGVWRACAGGEGPSAQALERMRRLYAASVRLLDDWVGSLLEWLDRDGRLGETLVVITSDHGENFGEGGLMGHAYSLDDRLIRVPLVASGPVRLEIAGPWTLAGLPAAIGAAAGISGTPWERAAHEPGAAVAQFDPPAGKGDPRVAGALEEWGLGPEAAPRITTPLTTATDGRFKLLRAGERELMFDLESDPLELGEGTALVPEPVLSSLRAALEGALPAGEPGSSATGSGDSEITDAEREKLEERMRLLGYL